MGIKKQGIVIFCIAILSGCTGNQQVISEPASQILHAIMECPNDELFPDHFPYIGIGDTEKTESEQKITNEDQEKSAWEAAVGDCFAGDMFTSFYEQWERTAYLGYAYAMDLQIEVVEISGLDYKNEIQHVLVKMDVTDSEGNESVYNQEWRIFYDQDCTSLVQKVELLDDDGFFSYE